MDFDIELTEVKGAKSPIGRLRDEVLVKESREPSWDHFVELGSLSKQVQWEHGIQLNLLQDGTVNTLFKKAERQFLIIPPSDEYPISIPKVFFHSHPEKGDAVDGSVVSIRPSFKSGKFIQKRGDFAKSREASVAGGLLNIVNNTGVCFCIGSESHTKINKKIALLRHGMETADSIAKPVVIIKSGDYAGKLIDDDHSPSEKAISHLGTAGNLLFTVRVPFLGEDFNMLFVRHEMLKQVKISPKELCFGSGVNNLVTKLGFSTTTHANNLKDALKGPINSSNI